jgi:hypothetical protein
LVQVCCWRSISSADRSSARLQRISLAMERATDLGDRAIRLPVERNDELGA